MRVLKVKNYTPSPTSTINVLGFELIRSPNIKFSLFLAKTPGSMKDVCSIQLEENDFHINCREGFRFYSYFKFRVYRTSKLMPF